MLGGNGQHAVLQVQVNVLLAEPGQIGFQQIVVALVPDVGAESGHLAAGGGEHAAFKLIKEIIPGLIHASKGNHAVHIKNSFRSIRAVFQLRPGPLLNFGLSIK